MDTNVVKLKDQVAEARAKKQHRAKTANPWMNITEGEVDTKGQPAMATGRHPNQETSDNSVLSGKHSQKEEAPHAQLKDGPERSSKASPLRRSDSMSTRKKKYWKPNKGAKTYYINSESQLQYREDSKDVTSVASTKDLPLSRLKPIYHKPNGMLIRDCEHFKQLYPNSVDRLGSLKGEYDIKIDPTISPVAQARRKVPIESREAIEEEIKSMIKQDILKEQVEPIPWVNTYPVKPTGQVHVCLDWQPLNKAIIREHHKAPTMEEIAHKLAGAQFFMKADAHKAFLQIHLTPNARLLTMFNWRKGWL